MPGNARFNVPQLDGLRFVAFLLVFAVHGPVLPTGSTTSPVFAAIASAYVVVSHRLGNFGVDLFFCLSAYLITTLLLLQKERDGFVAIGTFLRKRALRILPLYYGFLLIAFFVLPMVFPDLRNMDPVGSDAWQHTIRVHAIPHLLFFANASNTVNGAPNDFVAPLWSLSIEMQFYLVWPFVLSYFTARSDRVRNLTVLLIAVLAVGAVMKLYWILVGTQHPKIWLSSFTRLDAFAVGGLVALKRHYRPGMRSFPFQLFAGIAFVAANLVLPSPFVQTSYLIPVNYLCVAIGWGLVLDLLVSRPDHYASRLLAIKPLRVLGTISYGLYVYHVMGYVAARKVLVMLSVPLLGHWTMFTVTAFAITAAVAALSYYGFELRFLRLKDRLEPSTQATATRHA